MSVLRAEDVIVSRGRRQVLRGLSLAVRPGEMVALLGSNGSGKTTLLRAMPGFITPDEGQVTLDGTPILSLRRGAIARAIAYVPQKHRAVFPFTVREMVAMGRVAVMGYRSVARGDDAVASALHRAGIAHLADRPYTSLSGGEQQSVLIARALAQGAPFLLLDEPSAALDPGQKARLWGTLRALAREGMGILVSLHDPDAARRSFDRAVVMREGRVLADGPAAATLTEALLAVAYDAP
jgi:iron complex transport system ATP-binding protein